jgi:hypothetical protein
MWTAAGSGGDDKAHREFETAWRRRQRPENEVPISVAIDAVLADGQEAVVFISGARVFSNGVDFTLEVRARHGTNDGRGGMGWRPWRWGPEQSPAAWRRILRWASSHHYRRTVHRRLS